ncbi:unnamed protein product [Ilex paraguariensis]|uniref:Fe2OG dioxygenase domain-containing protein n=1 Tax=Ilex paraguariensis TaxID=185542 RepID=A0ABC8SG48_9AQUA
MVVLSRPVLDNFSLIKTSETTANPSTVIPEIDLLDPHAGNLIVKACEEYGFFKVINHGIPVESVTKLEAETIKFFELPQSEKDKTGTSTLNPFGYGNKRIGPNGDVGWIEYLLFSTSPQNCLSNFPGNSEIFWTLVNDYVSAVRHRLCGVSEMIADGLKIRPRNVLSRLLKDQKSDSCFRLNHYPPCPEHQAFSGQSLIGFGEHTDPQILSALRSNNTSGLQICLRDGTWVSVPADQSSLFINVGDSLQPLNLFSFIYSKR